MQELRGGMRPAPASKGDTARECLSAIQYRNATDGAFTIRISERKSNCEKQWVCSRYRSIAFFCMEAAIRGCSGPAEMPRITGSRIQEWNCSRIKPGTGRENASGRHKTALPPQMRWQETLRRVYILHENYFIP